MSNSLPQVSSQSVGLAEGPGNRHNTGTMTETPAPIEPRPRRRWPGRLLRLGLLLAVAVLGYEMFRVMGWTNRHTVIAGQIYRCAQPSGSDLAREVEEHGIRSIVNLRGLSPDYDWYREEARAAHRADLNQEDITLSANRLPPPSELRRLIDVLDHTERPILIHCKRGADRTGLASAIVRLLYTDDSLATARRQLWPRYGHFEFGRTAAIDQFFKMYESWLAQQGVEHSPARFRQWATTVYTPGVARSELSWLDPVPNPLPADKGLKLRLKATNRSTEPWRLKPGNYAGVFLSYVVADSSLQPIYRGQAGLWEETVPPGGSVIFNVTLPPLRTSGHFALVAEMTIASGASVPIRANSFVQFGDEAILADLNVK